MAFERLIKRQINKHTEEGNFQQAGLFSRLGEALMGLKQQGLYDPETLNLLENKVQPKHTIQVNRQTRFALIDGAPSRLTDRNLEVLGKLSEGSFEEPVTPSEIADNNDSNNSLAYVHIRRLRKVIEPDPDKPTIVRGNHGKGYFIDADIVYEDE